MSEFRKETEPLVASGRLFRGLLTFDERGIVVAVALIVDGILVEKDNAEQRAIAGIDVQTEVRMRQVLRLRYYDKLSHALANE